MVYVFIALGLAVVVAPLLSAMPSKKQRRQAALRDHARKLGVRVSMRPVPEVPARFRFNPSRELICYEQWLAAPYQRAGAPRRYVFAGGMWQPMTGVDPCPDWLLNLPAGALVAERSEKSISIFWDESDGVDGLEKIREVIDLID